MLITSNRWAWWFFRVTDTENLSDLICLSRIVRGSVWVYNQLQIHGTGTSVSHIPPSGIQTRSGRVVSIFKLLNQSVIYFTTLRQRAKKLVQNTNVSRNTWPWSWKHAKLLRDESGLLPFWRLLSGNKIRNSFIFNFFCCCFD